MTGQERREKILAVLEESGTVKSIEIAEAFGVSEKSIRRDIIELEGKGLLIRLRGGAKKLDDHAPPAEDMESTDAAMPVEQARETDAVIPVDQVDSKDAAKPVEQTRKKDAGKPVKKAKEREVVEPVEQIKLDDVDMSANQMKLELSEEPSKKPSKRLSSKAKVADKSDNKSEQVPPGVVVKTSRPEWILKAIEKNRPGTIVEPVASAKEEKPQKNVKKKKTEVPLKQAEPALSDAAVEPEKPKKDLNVIEFGTPIKPEALAELIRLADPESKKTMPIPSDEAAQQAAAKEPEVLPKKRGEERGKRPRRKARPAKPVKATEEVKASEPEEPPKPKKTTVSRKQKRPVTEAREDKRRKAEQPTRPRKKKEKQEETTPEKKSEKRKALDVVLIIIALVCLIGGTTLSIYVLFFAGDRGDDNGADVDMMHEMITHEELSFYVPENWNLLEGGGNDTVLRIRGRQGDIIGAMTVSTHAGNPGSTLEANFDEISARIHQGITDLQSDVMQFGNTPTRRHSYTDASGEREASLNTFLIPSGENIKYIQLRKPIDGFNQDLLTQFNEIVRSMNFQPSEFTREQ